MLLCMHNAYGITAPDLITYRYVHSSLLLIPVETIWIHTGGDAINLALHTTIEFKCTTNGGRTPDWFVNGNVAITTGDSYRSRTSNGGEDITTILTINGNDTQVTLNIFCEVYVTEERQFLRVHSTTVIFQGLLQLDSCIRTFLNYF